MIRECQRLLEHNRDYQRITNNLYSFVENFLQLYPKYTYKHTLCPQLCYISATCEAVQLNQISNTSKPQKHSRGAIPNKYVKFHLLTSLSYILFRSISNFTQTLNQKCPQHESVLPPNPLTFCLLSTVKPLQVLLSNSSAFYVKQSECSVLLRIQNL